jgi:hypothetical protein
MFDPIKGHKNEKHDSSRIPLVVIHELLSIYYDVTSDSSVHAK